MGWGEVELVNKFGLIQQRGHVRNALGVLCDCTVDYVKEEVCRSDGMYGKVNVILEKVLKC